MKQFYVYIHRRPDGTPFYVGKGHGKRSHDSYNGRNRHHKFVVQKYGRENITVEVFLCESEEIAFEREIEMIAELRGNGIKLVNLCNGGEGVSGAVLSAEHKAKIGMASKGNIYAKGCIRSEAFEDMRSSNS